MQRSTRIRAAVRRLVAAGIERSEAEYNVQVLLEESTKRAGASGGTALFQQWLGQRASTREPMQYILAASGIPWPWGGIELLTRPPVLCPRPETEEMLDILRNLVPRAAPPLEGGGSGLTMLEIGTGTGAISIAAHKGIRGFRCITAIDYSADAVKLARENAALSFARAPALVIEHCRMEDYVPHQPVDILCSNPPYLPSMPDQPEVAQWEDPEALLGGHPCGLGFIVKLLHRALALVRPGGFILLEVYEPHVHALAECITGEGIQAEQLTLAPATGLGPVKPNDVSLPEGDMQQLLRLEGMDRIRASIAWRQGYYDSFGRPRFVLLQCKGAPDPNSHVAPPCSLGKTVMA